MVGRTAKVSVETWIATAQRALVEEGIGGVKVDRLASRLGVTRGGFYHHFQDRDDLLAQLLRHWEQTCRFLPSEPPGPAAAEAVAWIQRATERLIEEDGYDHDFDMAVREWSRSDKRAAWAVERADRERMAALERFFAALGYPREESALRARVFYYHQIGYYSMGVRENTADRRRMAKTYLEILCGPRYMDASKAARRPAAPRRRAPAGG